MRLINALATLLERFAAGDTAALAPIALAIAALLALAVVIDRLQALMG